MKKLITLIFTLYSLLFSSCINTYMTNATITKDNISYFSGPLLVVSYLDSHLVYTSNEVLANIKFRIKSHVYDYKTHELYGNFKILGEKFNLLSFLKIESFRILSENGVYANNPGRTIVDIKISLIDINTNEVMWSVTIRGYKRTITTIEDAPIYQEVIDDTISIAMRYFPAL